MTQVMGANQAKWILALNLNCLAVLTQNPDDEIPSLGRRVSSFAS